MTAQVLVEDIEFMMNTGCTDAEVIVARLRSTGQATNFKQIQRALHRAGRYDLSRRFRHIKKEEQERYAWSA